MRDVDVKDIHPPSLAGRLLAREARTGRVTDADVEELQAKIPASSSAAYRSARELRVGDVVTVQIPHHTPGYIYKVGVCVAPWAQPRN